MEVNSDVTVIQRTSTSLDKGDVQPATQMNSQATSTDSSQNKGSFEPPSKTNNKPTATGHGTCRCSQNTLVGIMSKFSEEQKNAITVAGFGSLLKLKELDIRRELCKEIADSFDLETEEFMIGGKRLKMCIEDVEHILDLPSKGDDIKHPPLRQMPSLFEKNKGKESNKIGTTILKDYLKDTSTYGDDFVQKFLLYAIGTYLCPTLQPCVKSEYLGLIEDVGNIPNLNWSSIVLNDLMAAIKEYKGVKAANLKGNLALLQVWYWEKLSMSHMYPALEHEGQEKPLMQYWDENIAKERCKLALHDIRRSKHCTPTQSSTPADQVHSEQATPANQVHSEQADNTKAQEQMQEIKQMLTNQYTSLLNLMKAGFDALNKQVDDLIEEQRKPRPMEQSTPAKLQTSDTEKTKPAIDKKEDMSQEKLQPGKRPTSKRQRNLKKNPDFEYTTGTKRKRNDNTKQTEDDIPQVYVPGPNESTSNEYMIEPHQMATVNYIKTWPDNQVLVHIGLYTATKKNLDCLFNNSAYMNDGVMNAYIRILKAQPTIQHRDDGYAYLETTYDANKICLDTAASLKDKGERSFNLTRTLTYLSHHMVFFPINIPDKHWYLAVLNGNKGVIQVLDSMGPTSNRPELRKLLQGLQNRVKRLEHLNLIKKHEWQDTQIHKWKVLECTPDQMQFDSSSCGLFTLKFMELWTGNRLSTFFTQKDMNSFRLKLAVIHSYLLTISGTR
ncbi:unnamed protein product [Urochloa decumbens]|uniref:Ubiquitin-like protease family profile domain-containing protein n=1 Tax=Urochloa decumbens TaxID=240449 RepID=A0ABC9F771_9POAL